MTSSARSDHNISTLRCSSPNRRFFLGTLFLPEVITQVARQSPVMVTSSPAHLPPDGASADDAAKTVRGWPQTIGFLWSQLNAAFFGGLLIGTHVVAG